MKKFIINVFLALISCVVAIAGGEMAVRLFFPLHSTKLQLNHYEKDGVSFTPGAAWVYEEPEFIERVQINALGYRDIEIDISKPTLVFLGDSQTYGTGVNQGQRFSDRIRTALLAETPALPCNILNVAMPGTDTEDQVRMLHHVREQGVNVAHVYLCVFNNDHYHNYLKLQSGRGAREHSASHGDDTSASEPGLAERALNIVKKLRYRSQLFVFVLGRLQEFAWFRDFYVHVKFVLGGGELMEIDDTYVKGPKLRQWLQSTEYYIRRLMRQAPVSIVIVPSKYRYNPELAAEARATLLTFGHDPASVDFTAASRMLRDWANQMGIAVLDPAEDFCGYGSPPACSYPINGHLTEIGHRLIADYILARDPLLHNMLRNRNSKWNWKARQDGAPEKQNISLRK